LIKTEKEIKIIEEGSLILSKTHGLIASKIKPGIKTIDLDKIAYEFIKDSKAEPSFKGYKGFPSTICASVNNEIVHGLPSNYEIKEGDIVSVDCGVYYKKFHSDMAFTYPVGNIENKIINLLKITKESLYLGIKAIKKNGHIGDIGYKIQEYVENNNYSIVRELVGHGIGRKLHELPEIPNYGKRGNGLKIKEGMVFAIEPMVNLGTNKIKIQKNNWAIKTLDKKPSAHFEHTVAVLKDKVKILTTYDYINKFFKI